MKKTAFALAASFLFLIFTAGDCKKSSTEPGGDGGAPKIPSIAFSVPAQGDVVSDQCSYYAYQYVAMVNGYSTQFAPLGIINPVVNGNDYTWTVPVDSLTITVKATKQGDGSFVWEVKYDGTEDGVVYSNKVVATGTTTSSDSNNGNITIFDDNVGAVGSFVWSTDTSGVTATLTENDSPGGSPAYKIDISTSSATGGGGEVTASHMEISGWVQDFHATWPSTGAAATCN